MRRHKAFNAQNVADETKELSANEMEIEGKAMRYFENDEQN